MSVRILVGDARDMLRAMPEASVQCCVTSPPYFNLRSYLSDNHPDKAREVGTEQSPDAYVAEMVAVFREVRRVLADDGTVWLNLGSSYASSGRSRQSARALACDNDGTEPLGSPAPDCAYSDLDDEPTDGSESHRGYSADTGPQTGPERGPFDAIAQSRATLAYSELPMHPPGVRQSTNPSLAANVQGAYDPEATSSACRSSLPTYARGVRVSARKAGRTADTSSPSETSAVRKQDKGLSSRACDCNSCGICWAYLAIPLLRFKATDLISTPHLVALALQADGWFLRSSIVWAKSNPMPESVTSRPTSAHEMVFLLAKSERYFYDNVAIAEPAVSDHPSGNGFKRDARETYRDQNGARGNDEQWTGVGGTRNARNWWVINTQPYAGSHFAVMPADLAERCVRAGSSERGQCPHCAAPWARVLETVRGSSWEDRKAAGHKSDIGGSVKLQRERQTGTFDNAAGGFGSPKVQQTTGWSPTCACPEHAPVRQSVLDPFAGAGTTLLCADRLGRNGVGIELNPAYAVMARNRLTDDCPLFADVAD